MRIPAGKAAMFVLVLVLVAVAFHLVRRSAVPGPAGVLDARAPSGASAVAVDDASSLRVPPVEAVPTVPRALPSAGFDSREYGFRWNPQDPGVAASAEDARWLGARGFPGPDVERHLLGLPLVTLQELSERGNPAALAFYAYHLARRGAPREQVFAMLDASAASGSVYALKMAGDIAFTMRDQRDMALARAYYGLQARAGDQAGLTQAYMVDVVLSDEQRFRASLIEEDLWRRIRPTGGQEGEVRPGFKAFVEQGRRAPSKP